MLNLRLIAMHLLPDMQSLTAPWMILQKPDNQKMR